MKHYAGLDVSLEQTSVCILDETGKVCREIKVASHPEDLLRILQDPAWHFERIGLEAGLLSPWAFQRVGRSGLARGVHRDTPYQSVPESSGEQERPQRCARHRPDDAGQPLSSCPREDAHQPEATGAADSTQAPAGEGDRVRE